MKRLSSPTVKLAAKQIGENLATWRKLYNLTSQQLADKAAVSRATISRLESELRNVSQRVPRVVFSRCRGGGHGPLRDRLWSRSG